MIELFPGKRAKCKCGKKIFRIQIIGPRHFEIYCNKCGNKTMAINDDPVEPSKGVNIAEVPTAPEPDILLDLKNKELLVKKEDPVKP